MKKIIACILSMMLFLGSYTSVSAAQSPQLEKATVQSSTTASTKVDQTQFTTLHPDDVKFDGVSVSLIQYSISAHRETNGNVTLTINETFHSSRGYYEHLATDASGENFIPSKNTAYSTDNEGNEGIYTFVLSADSVSSDGYVYLKFAIDPTNIGTLFCEHNYKIPVDYNIYNTANSSYYTLDLNEEFIACFSAQLAYFTASATKQSDNSVEVIINVNSSNTNLWFKHVATSKDGDIFIPQKNSWYHISSDPITDRAYRLVLPENSVSSDGFVYLETVFDLPFGMTNAGFIKLAIAN